MEEIWKSIEGHKDKIEVSNFGRIRKIIEFKKKDYDGYIRIELNKNSNKGSEAIHRLVAKHFLENPDKKTIVNHKNGIKTDNRLENLEWCTPSENMKHAHKIGLFKKNRI